MNIRLVGTHGTGKSTVLGKYIKVHPEVQIWEGKSRDLRKLLKDTLDMEVSERTLQCIFNDAAISAKCHQPGHGSSGINLHTRSVFDNWAYCMAYGWQDLAEEYEKHIFEMIDSSDVFVYVPIKFNLVPDGIRPASVEFQHVVDRFLKEILDKCKINYYTLDVLDNAVSELESIIKKSS